MYWDFNPQEAYKYIYNVENILQTIFIHKVSNMFRP